MNWKFIAKVKAFLILFPSQAGMLFMSFCYFYVFMEILVEMMHNMKFNIIFNMSILILFYKNIQRGPKFLKIVSFLKFVNFKPTLARYLARKFFRFNFDYVKCE